MEITTPLTPHQTHSHYTINSSKIINEASSYKDGQAFYAEFLINLCLNSPSLKTSNKIYAISCLSKVIHNQLSPSISRVYNITFKALKYLTTQNIIEPSLLISIFSYSIEILYGVDMQFTYYLTQLVAQLVKKNNLKLSGRITQKIEDTETFIYSNIDIFNARLRTGEFKPKLIGLRDSISSILNIDTSETLLQQQEEQEQIITNKNEEYFYIISSLQLKQLFEFINEYLSYDIQEQQNEFNSFMDKAGNKETIKYYYYNKKYAYNLYNNETFPEVNCVPFAIDNSDIVIYKDSLSINSEESKENVYLKKNLEFRKDYFFINQSEYKLIDSIFPIKKEIQRTKTEVYYKDIKCFIINKSFAQSKKYYRLYKRYHIQISHYKTVKQFKDKIISIVNKMLSSSKQQTTNEYSINFFSVSKNNNNILNQLSLFNIYNESIFYCKDIQKLNNKDNDLMIDFHIDDDSLLIIDMFDSSRTHNIEEIISNKCTTCNKETQSHFPCNYNICCYGIFCSAECADTSSPQNAYHSTLHTILNEYYVKDLSIDEIASKSINSEKESCNGIHGLVNLNNTCFINSSIQCLFHTVDLTKYFYMNYYTQEINHSNKYGTKGEFASKYNDFILTMLKNEDLSVIAPYNIVDYIYNRITIFQRGEQNDAHEFINLLFENLHEDLNRISNKPYITIEEQKENESDIEAGDRFWNYHKQREDSIIIDLFYGQYKSTTTCPDCNKQCILYEPFNSIGLSIPEKIATLNIKYISIINNTPSMQVFNKIVIHPNTIIKVIKEHIKTKLNDSHLMLMAVVLNKRKYICKIICDNTRVFPYVKNGFEIYIYNTSHIKQLSPTSMDICVNIFVYPVIFTIGNSGIVKDNTKMKVVSYPILINVNITSSSSIIQSIMNELQLIYDSSVIVDKLFLFHNKKYYLDNAKDKPIREPVQQAQAMFHQIHSNLLSTKYCPLDSTINVDSLKNRLLLEHPTVMFANLKNYDPNNNTNAGLTMKYPYVNDPSFIPIEFNNDYIQLNLNKISITDILDLFQCEEKLEESNAWYCDKCKKHQEAYKKINIFKTSKYLIFQLKRFQTKSPSFFGLWSRNKKITTFITYDITNLNLSKYVIGPDSSKAIYDLYGVIRHDGSSSSSGHYTAICKTKNDKWIYFNDKKCKEIEVDKIVDKDAYLLFYKQKENKVA